MDLHVPRTVWIGMSATWSVYANFGACIILLWPINNWPQPERQVD